jgi:hypothetical protein
VCSLPSWRTTMLSSSVTEIFIGAAPTGETHLPVRVLLSSSEAQHDSQERAIPSGGDAHLSFPPSVTLFEASDRSDFRRFGPLLTQHTHEEAIHG